jgi:hypothetical protein
MRKLVVSTFVTLDGVMQAPGGPEEDPTEGFGHGGWSAGYWDEAMMERMGEVMGLADERPTSVSLEAPRSCRPGG